MALRDQPYIPLYIQDFMTDEKLIECSASTTGVYIRLICILHKSENYGEILLRQKEKQTNQQILNFATKLLRFMPYNLDVIIEALTELVEEKVITIDGDILYQKRMVKDGKLSEIRALAGKKGGENTSKKTNKFATAKTVANTEYEYEYEIEDDNDVNSAKNEEKYFEILKTYKCFDYELLSAEVKKKVRKELYDGYCTFVSLFKDYYQDVKYKLFPKIESFDKKLFSKYSMVQIEKGVITMFGYGIKENTHLISRLITCIGYDTKNIPTPVKPQSRKKLENQQQKKESWEIEYGHLGVKSKEEVQKLYEEGKIDI